MQSQTYHPTERYLLILIHPTPHILRFLELTARSGLWVSLMATRRYGLLKVHAVGILHLYSGAKSHPLKESRQK